MRRRLSRALLSLRCKLCGCMCVYLVNFYICVFVSMCVPAIVCVCVFVCVVFVLESVGKLNSNRKLECNAKVFAIFV